ncbi:hypothetical protein H2248_009124 [Termitomyces sp. 'cryptogamus']|nr:hypothetical protein H2248_009124 [Termitomyces sp. 'cryptogamus']
MYLPLLSDLVTPISLYNVLKNVPSIATLIFAAVTNRTIDNTNGDLITGEKLVYIPPKWQHPDCDGCGIKLLPEHASMQTYSALIWQDGLSNTTTIISIELSF